MNITEIKIRKLCGEDKLKAIVSVTLDNEFVIHDIKIIQGERLFSAMPSRRDNQGIYHDICHPVSSSFRTLLENSILEAYRNFMNNSL